MNDLIAPKSPEDCSKKGKPCIICISSGKGGVGKTSIALSLSRELSKSGKVLVVDMDYFNRGATGLLLGRLKSEQKGDSLVSSLPDGPSPNIDGKLNVQIDGIRNEPKLFFAGCSELSAGKMRKLEQANVTQLCNQLEKAFLHLADDLQYSCIILDAHGGPDTLSFAAASVADYTIMVTDPDKVTLYGTLNFVAMLRETLPVEVKKPRLKLLFNRVSNKFNWIGLTQIYADNLGDLFDGPLLGAVPFLPSIFENFASTPFISALFPNSLFAKKIQLITRELLGAERPELLSNEVGAWSDRRVAHIRESIQDRSLARPFPIIIMWMAVFVFLSISSIAIIYSTEGNPLIHECALFTGIASAFFALAAAVNSIQLFFQGMVTSYRFQSHTPLANLYRTKLILQVATLVIVSLLLFIPVTLLIPKLPAVLLYRSASRLRQITYAATTYACDNASKFPESLLTLVMDTNTSLSPATLLSPNSRVKIPQNFSTWLKADQFHWLNENSDYFYLGAGWKMDEAPTNVLAFESFDLAQGRVPVAFNDGHVQILYRDKAQDLIEKQLDADLGTLPMGLAAWRAQNDLRLQLGGKSGIGTIFDAEEEFSVTNGNPNRTWLYAESINVKSALVPYTETDKYVGGEGWHTSDYAGYNQIPCVIHFLKNHGICFANTLTFHPGWHHELSHVVWTATNAAAFSATSSFSLLDVGRVWVYVMLRTGDESSILSSNVLSVGSSVVTFSTNLNLKAGQQLDFAVAEALQVPDNDTTAIAVVIARLGN